jgi:hypothetical protein
MTEKFKVTNTTVKPQRIDPATKSDQRSALEKRGHAVQFRDESDRPIMLQAGQSTIVSRLDAGLLGLQRGGFINIEKIDNIADALKQHSYQPSNHQKNAEIRKAKANQMGMENYKTAGGSEYEGAVNPDGDPNFLVKARSSKAPKKKRSLNVSTAGSNTKK